MFPLLFLLEKVALWWKNQSFGEKRKEWVSGAVRRSDFWAPRLCLHFLRAYSVWVSGGSQVFVRIVLSPSAVIKSMQLATVHNGSVNPFIPLVFPEAASSHYGA